MTADDGPWSAMELRLRSDRPEGSRVRTETQQMSRVANLGGRASLA